MQTTKLTWVYVLLGAVLIALVMNLWYMLDSRLRGNEYVQVKADSLLEARIQGIVKSVQDIIVAERLHNDSLIESNRQEVKTIQHTYYYQARETIKERPNEFRIAGLERYLNELYDKEAREVGLADMPIDTVPKFLFSEKQVVGGELLRDKFELEQKKNLKLNESISLYQRNEVLFKAEIDSTWQVDRLRVEQIRKLENAPRQVVKEGWKWYEITGAIVGTALITGTIGYGIGRGGK